jgi:hypothetical protein
VLWAKGLVQIAIKNRSLQVLLTRELVLEKGLGVKGQSILILRGNSEDPYKNIPSMTVACL